MADMQMYANILLLIGGLVHAIPQLSKFLMFGMAQPWVQIIVGIISAIFALMLLFKK